MERIDDRGAAAPRTYGPDLLHAIARRCEADPEREVCGFVVRRGGRFEVAQVPNVADLYHASDPARHPRTSRDAYLMDPRALLGLLQELDASGGEIAAVWHSHVEGAASFSARDRADAVVDGVQQVPGAEYLVFAVRGGRVTEQRRFRWVGGEFVEAPL
jgi:proteasome lid subunit RPN8/RPN11